MTAVSADLAPAATPRSRRGRFALIAAALLAPMALINLVAFVFPVLRLAQISFQESRSSGVLTDVYSFRNYLSFFTDSFNLSLIANSLAMSFAVTLATLACAYPIAMFLHRAPAHWRNILFVITVSPLLVSSVVRTYGWMVLLGDQGLVNGALLSLGLVQSPLRLVNNMTGVFIGLVEILMPYMALSLMAGFGRLEASHEEAAASLGAGPFTRFRRIVLPLTLPGIALGCLLCFVLAISSFITPKLLGGGRVFLLATEIYDQAVIQLQWPMAATISVVVLIIFGAALAAYARIVRRFD